MKEQFYERIGRLYLDVVDLHKNAEKLDLYVGGGFDRYGDFSLSVYDMPISNGYYYSQSIQVKPETLDLMAAEIAEVRGFVNGFAKATEIERKRAEEAAKPEIDFVTGKPLKEESREELSDE